MSTVDDLLNRGLIESVESDDATAAKWLEDAGRHLDAAQRIIDLDLSGAYVLACDAARKWSCAKRAATHLDAAQLYQQRYSWHNYSSNAIVS